MFSLCWFQYYKQLVTSVLSTGRVDPMVGSGQDFYKLRRMGLGRVENVWCLVLVHSVHLQKCYYASCQWESCNCAVPPRSICIIMELFMFLSSKRGLFPRCSSAVHVNTQHCHRPCTRRPFRRQRVKFSSPSLSLTNQHQTDEVLVSWGGALSRFFFGSAGRLG